MGRDARSPRWMRVMGSVLAAGVLVGLGYAAGRRVDPDKRSGSPLAGVPPSASLGISEAERRAEELRVQGQLLRAQIERLIASEVTGHLAGEADTRAYLTTLLARARASGRMTALESSPGAAAIEQLRTTDPRTADTLQEEFDREVRDTALAFAKDEDEFPIVEPTALAAGDIGDAFARLEASMGSPNEGTAFLELSRHLDVLPPKDREGWQQRIDDVLRQPEPTVPRKPGAVVRELAEGAAGRDAVNLLREHSLALESLSEVEREQALEQLSRSLQQQATSP